LDHASPALGAAGHRERAPRTTAPGLPA